MARRVRAANGAPGGPHGRRLDSEPPAPAARRGRAAPSGDRRGGARRRPRPFGHPPDRERERTDQRRRLGDGLPRLPGGPLGRRARLARSRPRLRQLRALAEERPARPDRPLRPRGGPRRPRGAGPHLESTPPADVAELVYAPGLGPGGLNRPWGFESLHPHDERGPHCPAIQLLRFWPFWVAAQLPPPLSTSSRAFLLGLCGNEPGVP